jgi:hypothetical protein
VGKRGGRTLGVLVGCAALALSVSGPVSNAAARTQPKDCGRLAAGIGGVGHLPSGVPAGSVPQVDAFRVSGHLTCKTVHSVMQSFENNASSTLTINKPPAPGWTCKFNKKAQGYVCKKGPNVIEDQIVWKLHGTRVGPLPRTP